MEERIRHLLERFPERADVIRALSQSHDRFKDLIGDHHEVSEALARMKLADQESQAGRKDELERRRADLEEELILLMQNHQRM